MATVSPSLSLEYAEVMSSMQKSKESAGESDENMGEWHADFNSVSVGPKPQISQAMVKTAA